MWTENPDEPALGLIPPKLGWSVFVFRTRQHAPYSLLDAPLTSNILETVLDLPGARPVWQGHPEMQTGARIINIY